MSSCAESKDGSGMTGTLARDRALTIAASSFPHPGSASMGRIVGCERNDGSRAPAPTAAVLQSFKKSSVPSSLPRSLLLFRAPKSARDD